MTLPACSELQRPWRSLRGFGLGWRGQWQPDRERRAVAGLAGELDRAAVRLHQRCDDGEPKPGPARPPHPRRIAAPEALEDARLILDGDAWAVVGNRQIDVAVGAADR